MAKPGFPGQNGNQGHNGIPGQHGLPPNPLLSGGAQQPFVPPMMPPPMVPPMAGAAAGGGAGGRDDRRRRWHDENGSGSSEVILQALDGGRLATFDPVTGTLRAATIATGQVGGVLGYFGETLAVFYRKDGRLTLRLGANEFDLDSPAVGVGWEQRGPRQARFQVHVDGHTVTDFPYPLTGLGTDLGLLVRDVLADPRRCATIFS
ncbi:hypothetical protein [Nocardia brasiliensis]|uniref:hypothetical protein n=1 Tax=Nocardia brasiliensis TaxID=37326 RepID=UPI002454F897|nr:hypothetical protein [Nocardia brasiliensis]